MGYHWCPDKLAKLAVFPLFMALHGPYPTCNMVVYTPWRCANCSQQPTEVTTAGPEDEGGALPLHRRAFC